MKSQIRRHSKVLVVAGILFLWVFFSARSDYRWGSQVIGRETSRGWKVIYQQRNLVRLAAPWTWIKTPITGVWFIDESQTRRINDGIYLVRTLRATYDYSKTDRQESLDLIDVGKGESAYLDPEQNPAELDIKKVEWQKYPTGTPGDKIIQYVFKSSEVSR